MHLAQHGVPTVDSVVAAVSAFSSASVQKLSLSLPLLSLWAVDSDSECVCMSGCLLVCVRVRLRYFQSRPRGWYVVLITKSQHYSVDFLSNLLHGNQASTAAGCTAVASSLFHQQIG